MRLSDMYDADKRITDEQVRRVAESGWLVPHPLNNVQYADGISVCRHAKKHKAHEACMQKIRW